MALAFACLRSEQLVRLALDSVGCASTARTRSVAFSLMALFGSRGVCVRAVLLPGLSALRGLRLGPARPGLVLNAHSHISISVSMHYSKRLRA